MDAPEFCILVVDDDEGIVRTLTASLRGPNRKVLSCLDPRQVPGILAAQHVDLVISDEQMPQVNGVRLLSMLRETHPDVARVLLTGHGTVETAAQAINEAAVFKFLTKPWRKEQLEAVVQAAQQRTLTQRRPPAPITAEARRKALLAELEREHPGILHVPDGTYYPRAGAASVGLDNLVASALRRDLADEARAQVERLLVTSGPEAAVDALLAAMVRHAQVGFAVEPSPSGHALSMEAGSSSTALLSLPRGVGDTVAARCAVLAGLDVGAMGEQTGHRFFKLGEDAVEILIVFRTSSAGLAVELRRVDAGAAMGPAPAPLAPATLGQVGPYRVLEVLGHGGLGVVYRAVHEVLERPVAVKLLHAPAHDSSSTARFLREARAASRAKHPGIVDIIDFGRNADGRPYLVMELVEADTLEDRLAGGGLPLGDAVAIAHSIASALAAAHEAGVVHRDLKPSNIFVDDDLSAKLTDFGAAKMVGVTLPSLTQEGTTIGTPHYMSPEQARGLAVDRRSDLYALGCLLYEMIVGARPYEGPTSLDVLSQHIGAAVPVPVSPREPVPHALARVIRRAMAKSPSERHQTAAEIIADLAQAELSLGRDGWRRFLP
jgi:serine/threonine-protein kinase